MKIIDLESEERLSEFLSDNKKTIIDFYANWCGPCKNLSKTFDIVSSEEKFDGLSVIKINVDSYQDIARKFNVRSLPTVVFTESSKVIKTKVGNISKNDLVQIIRETYEYSK